jgi:pilus assembly protein CpaE
VDERALTSNKLVVTEGEVLPFRSFAMRTLAQVDAFDRRDAGIIGLLIVDDIRETVDHLERILESESQISLLGVATTGLEGIEAARRLRPDVILMDIHMPLMDGLTATRHILEGLPHIGVVVMSIQNGEDYMRRARLAGARDYLIKPFSREELVGSVRRLGRMVAAERVR